MWFLFRLTPHAIDRTIYGGVGISPYNLFRVNRPHGAPFFYMNEEKPKRNISMMIPDRRRDQSQRRRVEYFLIGSIVFHIILLILFSFITLESLERENTPLVVEFEEPDDAQKEFNDFPQENETDEEVESDRLSDKNRKVEEESIVKGSPLGGGYSPPASPPPQPPAPEVEPSEEETETSEETEPEETTSHRPELTAVEESEVIDDILAGRTESQPNPSEERAEKTPSPFSPESHDRLAVEDLLPDGNDVARLDIPYGTTSPDVKEEETVSLNTQEFKYYAYFSHIKRHIEMAWNYPLEAQKNQWEGRLNLTFVVEADGTVSDIILIRSSGYEVLDEAAIKAINFASPFNPIPESIGVRRLRINASFEYVSSLFGVR